MRISDWSSDVCSSDLGDDLRSHPRGADALRSPEAGCRDRAPGSRPGGGGPAGGGQAARQAVGAARQIGRASCRERVSQSVSISVVAVSLKKKNKTVIQRSRPKYLISYISKIKV